MIAGASIINDFPTELNVPSEDCQHLTAGTGTVSHSWGERLCFPNSPACKNDLGHLLNIRISRPCPRCIESESPEEVFGILMPWKV